MALGPTRVAVPELLPEAAQSSTSVPSEYCGDAGETLSEIPVCFQGASELPEILTSTTWYAHKGGDTKTEEGSRLCAVRKASQKRRYLDSVSKGEKEFA